MRIFFNFIYIFILLFVIFIQPVDAVDINMNIENTVNSNAQNIVTEEVEEIDLPTDTSSKVSTTQVSENFTLSISDIINIILIAVGIVLIFLSIAILIRLKN